MHNTLLYSCLIRVDEKEHREEENVKLCMMIPSVYVSKKDMSPATFLRKVLDK